MVGWVDQQVLREKQELAVKKQQIITIQEKQEKRCEQYLKLHPTVAIPSSSTPNSMNENSSMFLSFVDLFIFFQGIS